MAQNVVRLAVIAVDMDAGTIQVTLPSGDSAYVPAPADAYPTDAWVVMDGGQPLYALGPVSVANGYAGGTIASISGGNAVVNVSGGGQVTVPLLSGSYGAGDSVWLSTDSWGRPVMGSEWLASSGNDAVQKPPAKGDSSGSTGSTPRPVAARAQLAASSVGTWRPSKGTWNSWQAGRFGWPAVAYQGSKYGSGTLVGVIGFGDQIVALGATSIRGATLTIRRSDGDGGVVAPVAIGIADGAAGGAPPAGITATYGGSGAGSGGGSSIGLGSDVLSGFRSGAVKGLALVGTYSAWVSATLTIDYMRNA